MIATIKDISRGMKGELQVTIALPPEHTSEMLKMQGEQLDVNIKKYRAKRTVSANNLLWALCQDIAKAMPTPHTDKEIYRHAIRDVGEYVPLPIKDIAVQTFIEKWGKNGIGWVVEVTDKSKTKGYTLLHAYYGSSTYNSAEMARVLDYLVDEAQQMGIPLMASKEQIEEAKRRWGKDAV